MRLLSACAASALAVCALPWASAARAFSTSALAFSTVAAWLRTAAFAVSTSAFAWFTWAAKIWGSIRAMIWPFLTTELKSTRSSLI